MNNFLRISSKDNDVIKYVSQLQKSTSKRKNEGVFVLEGYRLCMDAVVNGFDIEKLIMSDSAINNFENDISVFAENSKIAYVIPDSLFIKISDTVNPQGILCVCAFKNFNEDILHKNGKYIALENLQDPSNLGAISRTAEAFGIDALIISGGCDPYNSKSLRASMGALLRIPIIRTDNLFAMFEKADLKSFAAVVHGDAIRADKANFTEGSVVVIGNEANGLSDETIDKSDYRVTIPMSGKAESLNAGVAAAILMWEMCK